MFKCRAFMVHALIPINLPSLGEEFSVRQTRGRNHITNTIVPTSIFNCWGLINHKRRWANIIVFYIRFTFISSSKLSLQNLHNPHIILIWLTIRYASYSSKVLQAKSKYVTETNRTYQLSLTAVYECRKCTKHNIGQLGYNYALCTWPNYIFRKKNNLYVIFWRGTNLQIEPTTIIIIHWTPAITPF